MPDHPPHRDCLHPRAQHVHGSRAAYVRDGCRCAPCREANRRSNSARTRAIAYGRWAPFVDAAPARDHVEQLRAAGIGLERIVALSGAGSGTLRRLLYRDARTGRAVARIRPQTEARLLAVGEGARANGTVVDATGTRRRLQALVAAGWRIPRLAELLGRHPGSLRRTLRSARVRQLTATAVATLYRDLEATPPPMSTPSQRRDVATAQALAAANGWWPPLAWDDIDADPEPQNPPIEADAEAGIDEVAVERAVRGERVGLTLAEEVEVMRRLRARGLSIRRIAGQLGTSGRTVARRLECGADEACGVPHAITVP